MTSERLRRVALAMVDATAWLVPDGERRRWRAQWRADIWHRCDVLARTELTNTRTALALLGRVAGAVRHAAWLRRRHGGARMMWHDVRQAVRTLAGRPAFTAIAVLTLALGIGANTVIFSWIEATLLNTIPGAHDPRSLVAVYVTSTSRDNLSVSYPNFVDLRDATLPGVAELAAYSTGSVNLQTAGSAERVWCQIVSGNMLSMLGVRPARGRLLGPDDDRVPGGHPVAVVSHRFWQDRMGGTADVLGTTLVLNGHGFTIVGVTEPGFHGTQPLMALEVFLPLAMQQAFSPGNRLQERGSSWLQTLVRLSPGASLDEVQSGLDVAAARLAAAHPDANAGRGLRVFPLWRQPAGGASVLLPVMAVLGGLVAVLLGLVCANLAGLLLARAGGRQRELAVRRSLGASRLQLARLLIAESLLLALAGGALALVVSRWSGSLFLAFVPPVPLPLAIEAGTTGSVWLFSVAASVAVGLALGLLPSLYASRDGLTASLKNGSSGAGSRWQRGRFRQGLIVVQVAMSLVLLVSAGLFLRTLQGAQRIDPGFAARQGLTGNISVGGAGYDEARSLQLYEAIVREVRALPHVEAAALAQSLPLTVYGSSDRSVEVEGYTPDVNEEMAVYYASTTDGLFETIQMPLVAGRDFDARDSAASAPVVIVNQTMARRYWPSGRALGGRVKVGEGWADVVGIVTDAKYSSLTEAPRPFMYLPVRQAHRPVMRLVVRTAGDPASVVASIREAVRRVDPGLPLFDIQTLAEHRAFSMFLFEMAATLLGLFGIVAIVLAALGLYGVVAISVGQRTREIGVRMSLGADVSAVRWLVLRQGLGLATAGVAIGLLMALGVTRLFSSQLLGISPYDPLSYGGTALVLLATTAFACYLPARRAARLNPVQALRTE